MKTFKRLIGVSICLAVAAIVLFTPSTFAAPPKPQSGTTLAAYKTLDICEVTPETENAPAVWYYSGVIAVWNEGAVPTEGLAIVDVIQNKLSGPTWNPAYSVSITLEPAVIPAGTTREEATVFTYGYEGPALLGDIRNVVTVTITNHSGSLGTPKGPEPKATWNGLVVPCEALGCTYTQGYWDDKPDVVWPDGYLRDAIFFLSGQTWQDVLDTPVGGNGYYILAYQYIAAVLNKANGAFVPQGVQNTLVLAQTWFSVNGPSACPSGSSCGLQKGWAAVLDLYNKGLYPGGPLHCPGD